MEKIRPITIGNRQVGQGNPAYIIFEVASTHGNNWKIAKDYVQQAKEAEADALKFQLFTADTLLNPISTLLKPTYDYFKTAETPRSWFPKLKLLCDKAGIDLLCTPFDEDSASFLNKTGLPAIKIASGDLTYHQLLVHVAKFNKPVILSTGMGTIDEVIQAVEVLKRGGCNNLAILQCTSVYPMPYEDANIRAMNTLGKKFKTVVGYSDNGSKGILISLLAVAKGASIIEKHVTSQKQRGSMDDLFSLSVEEFAKMVKEIRLLEKDYQGNLEKAVGDLEKEFGKDVQKALGSAEKKPAEHGYIRENGTRFKESDERHWARRGLYLKSGITKGTEITPDLLISLRPDIGISALEYERILNTHAAEDLPARYPLKLTDQGIEKFTKKDIRPSYTTPDEAEFAKILADTALFD